MGANKAGTKKTDVDSLTSRIEELELELEEAENSIAYWEEEYKRAEEKLYKALLIGIDDETMVDEMKLDFLREHWEDITLEMLESLIK